MNCLTISWLNFCIFSSASMESLSIKSRIHNLALYEIIFFIFLLFTKWASLIKFIKFSYLTSKTLPSSWIWACLNKHTLLFFTKYSMKFLYSSLNKYPFYPFSFPIFNNSSQYVFYECSGLALFISKITPSWISIKVLKDFNKFRISFGNLSALTSETEL